METFCIIVCVCVALYLAAQILQAVVKANDEKNERINRHKTNLDNLRNDLKARIGYYETSLKNFFLPGTSRSYGEAYTQLTNEIASMESTIAQMKRINSELVSESRHEDQTHSIATAEARVIPLAKQLAEGFKAFGERTKALPASEMMDEETYGKIQREYWDTVCGLHRSSVEKYIAKCEELLGSNQFEELYKIEIAKVLKCVWFFATEKTFSASDFQRAEAVFARIYRDRHADLIIAGLYAKKKMGGEDVLRDPVRDALRYMNDARSLTLIASGLMWMNAYHSENTVLQHMLNSGKEMSAKTQERLHSLTNGGGKAPSGFDVQSSADALYFDVSALAWKDDEYIGLFENLAFQDKILSYSLAVRDENKELFIPQGIHVPEAEAVLNKFEQVFAEEYGPGVTAKNVNCIAISGSGEEKLDGILVSSGECKQMGLLLHIARIGKKLIIKFYTLFMPTESDLKAQRQQALSMSQKLSPTVTMWESSMKDTMLRAVEQLLNTAGGSSSSASGAAPGANTPVVPQTTVVDKPEPDLPVEPMF